MRIFRPPSSATETFAALRHRNYRLWFGGQLVSRTGTGMQLVAQGYLLYTLTGSVAALGYVGFVAGLPSWLLLLYGGLLADRMPRRTLLGITQASKTLLAFLLAALVGLHTLQPWHLVVVALLEGVANALETPARKALVGDLVPRADLTNAITLSDALYNVSVIVGPAVGAAVYAGTGPGWCFFLNGVSFLAVLAALRRMRLAAPSRGAPRGSVRAAVAEGVRYIRGHRLVRTLTISELLISLLGYGPLTLLPAWAVTVLHGDVTLNGTLLAVNGSGAVLGGLLLAARARRGPRGRVWTAGSLLLPLALLGFTLARPLPLAFVCLGLSGLAYVMVETNNSAILQARVPDALRGRVIGLFTLMYTGGEPLGALGVGVLAERTSTPFTVGVCALGLLCYALLIFVWRPEVRDVT